MKLEDLFGKAIASIDVEKLEAVLTQKLQKTTEEVIADAIGGYRSEFRQGLEKNVAEMMGVVGEKLNIHSHADNISRLAAQALNAEMNTGAQRHLQELMATITSKPPETIKLSEIVKMVKSDYTEDGEMTLLVDDKEYFKSIAIDDREDTREFDCKVRLGCHEPDEDGACRTFIYNYKKPVFQTFDSLDKIMFWLQQCGTRLVIDEDDCDTSYDNDDN